MDLKRLNHLTLMVLATLMTWVAQADVAQQDENQADSQAAFHAEHQVFPIEPVSDFEPSGLTIKDGALYTVSDKHATIYRIDFENDRAVMIPVVDIDVTELGALNLDLEGITHDGINFYLASEAHHRLIRVTPDGQTAWVTHDGSSFFPAAEKAGLFQVFNAALEGLTYVGQGTFLMAAERQPRGLIEVQFDSEDQLLTQNNHVLDQSSHHLPKDRTPDLTGLYEHKGDIFALHRNAELIHRWVKNESGEFIEADQWSFAHIVNAPENQYHDMTYGHAEGLAVDDEYFYIVIDNNGQAKAKLGNDKRPLLILLRR